MLNFIRLKIWVLFGFALMTYGCGQQSKDGTSKPEEKKQNKEAEAPKQKTSNKTTQKNKSVAIQIKGMVKSLGIT